MRLSAAAIMMAFVPAAMPAFAQSCQNNPAAFPAWLDDARAEAQALGISANAVRALDGVRYDQSIVNRDRAQGVFSQTFLEFSDRVVSSSRPQTGQQHLTTYATLFAQIERRYGVPGAVVVALWAMESDFGANVGDVATIAAMATLAFDCRRPEEFRPQLLDALRIVDRGDLTAAQMAGAWAGELGQTQFRPSEYYQTGVDFDGDGRVDLLRSVPDVLASTANLLVFHGWQAGQPWLEEVVLTRDLPWEETGVYSQLPRSQWAAWGVTRRDGSALPADQSPAMLVLPMGKDGPAFIAYPNMLVLLRWNESLVNSLTIAYLATRYVGAPRVLRGGDIQNLSVDQIRELQTLLARNGFDVGGVDGVIGALTRAAVREVQLGMGLPADGYPIAPFLNQLRGGPAPPAGMTTAEVAELQTLLTQLGYDTGGIDGVAGPRTRAAVAAVQAQLGLPADGVPTLELLERLRGR
jgi:lytic murein transglycosylase